ncbi:MAG TPA: hypothetical protein VN761_00035 [Candidatus Polarisedimenticolia bacterium]|nr:hypothetical protein [Candidatus Polarisedimenticolia bacterium]
MKNTSILICVLLFLLSAARLSAQMTVEVLTDQNQFLAGEAMPVTVRITNRSGQTLVLGRGEGWLKFVIQARDGFVPFQNGEPPVAGEFTLQSSERANVRVNLAPYFRLPKAGHYNIIATVTIPEWKRQISSDPKGFDIISGAKLWEQDFGVPKAPGDTNAAPEMRHYALQEANYLRSHLELYAQVTDDIGKINKVIPIGPMVSFGQPEAKVDKVSDLHVLYQNGPRTFSYTVINPNGEIVLRQTYEYTTRPQILPDNNGNLTVVGGQRRFTREDFPPPKSSAVNDTSAPPKP